jgi:hypothetical protein
MLSSTGSLRQEVSTNHCGPQWPYEEE